MDWLQPVATLASVARKVSMLRSRYKRRIRVTRALQASVATARESLRGVSGGEGEIALSVLDPLLVRADDLLSNLTTNSFPLRALAMVLSDEDDAVTAAEDLIRDFQAARRDIPRDVWRARVDAHHANMDARLLNIEVRLANVDRNISSPPHRSQHVPGSTFYKVPTSKPSRPVRRHSF